MARSMGRQRERSMDPQRDDVYTPSSGNKTARIIDFMATKRQLKPVVGDAANANFHAEEKGKPCCKQLGDILNASTAEGKPIDVVIVL